MKNVAPNARSLDSDRPLTMAAIACSRMPKCRFLPPGLSAWKSPAPSNFRVVLFDGPRSAEPPMNHGMFCASTLSTLPEASRPAMPFGSAGKTGRFCVPSGRQLTALHLVDLGREFGELRSIRREKFRPRVRGLARRARRFPRRSARARRRAPETWRLRASRSYAWRAGLPPRPAVRHAPRRCPACAASRSRCGCPG